MRGILVGALLIVALMVAIKDGRVLRATGMRGICHAVTTPRGEEGSWQACDPGKLEGAPDLSRQGCKSVQVVGKTEYWRCPAAIKSSHKPS
jgi:hypothetical protein